MVMDRNYTFGGEHVEKYAEVDNIMLYTWNLYNVIN